MKELRHMKDMDYKDLSLYVQSGQIYGVTATAKYKLDKPSDSSYLQVSAAQKRPAQISFDAGLDTAFVRFFAMADGVIHKKGDVCYYLNVEAEPVETFKKKIAARNDEFRKKVLTQPCDNGKALISVGVDGLAKEQKDELYKKVKAYNDFRSGNDPHQEHDFGAIVINGGQKVFWKIDYYADDKCKLGTMHTAESYMVMSLMFAEEY